VCVYVFCVAVFGEIRDSMDMFMGVWGCPVVQDGSYSSLMLAGGQPANGPGVVVDNNDESDATSSMDWMRRKLKKEVTESVALWNLSRMTKVRKYFDLAVIVFPKLAIGTLTLVFGCKYIMGSPDSETLIMNTLAVLFVLDLDEYIYQTFTTTTVKARIDSMEHILLNPSSTDRVAAYFMTTFGIPLIVGSATLGFVYSHRTYC